MERESAAYQCATCLVLPHHTYARNSMPTPCRAAWRSVSRPDEVEMIATPTPPSTRGRVVVLGDTRRPALEIRRRPAMLRSRLGPYFSCTTSALPTRASSGWVSGVYPPRLRAR